MYCTSSPSRRNQLLLSRDRELFLRIARTRRIALSGSRITCRSFLPTLVSHREDKRQKGKVLACKVGKIALDFWIFFFSSPVSSHARCSIYEKWSLIRADSYITSLKISDLQGQLGACIRKRNWHCLPSLDSRSTNLHVSLLSCTRR